MAEMQSEENIKAVELLRLICATSIGPRGNLKVVQNNCGGHVTVTSTSSRLITNIRISNPVVRVISSAATTHFQKQANDGGFYLMLLASELLINLWKVSAELPQNTVAQIFDDISKCVVQHLNGECDFKLAVNFDSLKVMLAIVNTVIRSKPGCQLSKCERKHVVGLILKAFLEGMPCDSSAEMTLGTLHYVSQCGMTPEHSRLIPGLLLPQEDLEWSVIDRQLVDRYVGKELHCALFRVSLSGDADVGGLSEAQWTIDGGVKTVINACTAQILVLCEQVVVSGVKVVACQKVIHPRVKKYLKCHGVVTLDRLGQINFNALVDLTGAVPIESFIRPLDKSCLGRIESLATLTVHGKPFCHFECSSSRCSTLVICNYHQESLEELMGVCRQGISTLRGLLHTPCVFYGGGCLEIHLASLVKGLLSNVSTQSIFSNNKSSQVMRVMDAVASSFQQVAADIQKVTKIDLRCEDEKQHLWVGESEEKCACGLTEMSDSVHCPFGNTGSGSCWNEPSTHPTVDEVDAYDMMLDSFHVKFHAVKSALEVIGTLLKVDNIIK